MDQKKEGLNGLENEEISSSDVAQSEELVQMDAAEATDKKPETPQSTIFVKHEYNTKKPVKNGGSKRILICVISLVLCIAIAGGVFLINRFLPNDEEGTSSSGVEDLSFSVLKYSDVVKSSFVEIDGQEVEVETNIKGVGIYNYYENYAIIPYYELAPVKDETESRETASSDEASSATTSSTDEKKTYLYDTKWYINGIAKDLVLSDELFSHIKSCLNITAAMEMENTFESVEAYHKYYGIDDPTRAFLVEFNDGTEDLEILVGKQTATKNANYVKIGDNDTVYMVADTYIANYDHLPSHFADLQLIDAIEKSDDNGYYFNDNDDLARFDYIKINGTVVDSKNIEFGMSQSASADYMPYVMLKPYNRAADEAFIEKILAFAQSGLTADGLYTFNATKENKELAVMNNPGCVIEFKAGEYEFKLTVGGIMDESTGDLSIMIEGKNQIFSISNEIFGFITSDITSMFNDDFIMEDIYTVKTFTLTDSTGSYRYELQHTARAGEENVYDTVVKYKGKEVDVTSFKRLYQRVLLLSMLSFVTEAPEKEPVFSVEFGYIAGGTKLVEFTESNNDIYHYVVWVDGTPLGEVLVSSVKDITDNLAKYVAGKEVTEVW